MYDDSRPTPWAPSGKKFPRPGLNQGVVRELLYGLMEG